MRRNKGTNILILSLAFSGILSTSTGLMLNNMSIPTSNVIDVKVVEKQVSRLKSNVPVLKDIEVELNQPISVDVKDYITNMEDISTSVLRAFKLDTSLVNVTQPGKYTYYIEYKNKKYNGNVLVKAKEEEKINTLHLKNFSVKVNEDLPNDVSKYLDDILDAETLSKIQLDKSKVDTTKPGDYQYTITYNKMMYTGTITVYQEQATQVLNTVKYSITYACGTETKKVPLSKTSTTKEITLEEKDVLKSKPDFDNCTSEIDYTKVKISFPKLVEDGGGFTVYFKEIPTTTSNVQPTTEITNQN